MMDNFDPKTYFSLAMHNGDKSVSVRFEGQDITVTHVLDEVLNFMKACGYCFDIDDRLDVVNDFKFQDTTTAKQLDLSWLTDDYPDPEMVNFDPNNPNHIIKPEDC